MQQISDKRLSQGLWLLMENADVDPAESVVASILWVIVIGTHTIAGHFFSADFGRVWPLTPRALRPYFLRMANSEYLTEYDAIVRTMQLYIDGSKQGKSERMRPAFHRDASFFGYAGGQLAVGTQFLFDWIDKNGPAPSIEPRVASVDIIQSIAVVRLEVASWSGHLAGSGVRMSDLFTLLKTPEGWKIIQKAFHWHA